MHPVQFGAHRGCPESPSYKAVEQVAYGADEEQNDSGAKESRIKLEPASCVQIGDH
ncbi:hypothetical protein Mro03_01300 [Microbispora rosea subsp. rosea]|nr:hypothetical protein Mro03_01300 [Microbispora rosea subsp. rosea]